jgi:hypothetical protein
VQLEGLGQLKRYGDLIGNGTCNLPACSIVPQPIVLLHASASQYDFYNLLGSHMKFLKSLRLKNHA